MALFQENTPSVVNIANIGAPTPADVFPKGHAIAMRRLVLHRVVCERYTEDAQRLRARALWAVGGPGPSFQGLQLMVVCARCSIAAELLQHGRAAGAAGHGLRLHLG